MADSSRSSRSGQKDPRQARRSDRSRSRSVDIGSHAQTSYRERSKDRGVSKYSKLDREEPLLVNTSYSSTANSQEYEEEQSNRGRSRSRDEKEVLEDADGEDTGVDGVSAAMGDDMMSMMGFGGFGSTKNKHVEGAKGGYSKKAKSSEFRQYMNRTKGFNRPLSPTRDDKKKKKTT